MNELALFAGVGGGILGGKLCGWKTVCAVEIEPYAIGVLLARQNDGSLNPFPIWDDVRTFNGFPWRGIVDLVSGGFPCQDISAAGKGEGIAGERSGLWKEFLRIISEVRPRYAFIENSPMLRTRGLATVLSDLAGIGYNAKWRPLSAKQLGASHRRNRMWILASNSDKDGQKGSDSRHYEKENGRRNAISALLDARAFPRSFDDIPSPYVLRAGDGVPGELDRVAAIGNAQVPIVAALAWNILSEGII